MPTYYVRDKTDLKVSISEKHFVGSGGEKKVYGRGKVAYCVYHDPKNAIPVNKIDELKKVNHSGFIAPTSILLDVNKKRVGETMPLLDDTYVLCQLFSKKFRRQNGIDHRTDLSIIAQMFEIMSAVHDAGIVLVDANDMNWLVSKDFKNVYLIDTTSCKTPKFNATAIKPAIYDPRCNRTFTKDSDYYSMAVVVAWLWCGIHPFCCDHKGSKENMSEKMTKGLTVFDKTALLNGATRDPNSMPKRLKEWDFTCLSSRKRPAPPLKDFGITTKPKPRKAVATGVDIGNPCSVPSGIWINLPQLGDTISIYDHKFSTTLSDEVAGINYSHVFKYGTDFYTCSGMSMDRVSYRIVNGRVKLVTSPVASLADLPLATVYGRGCVVQNLLGKQMIVTPEHNYTIDLSGTKVLDAGFVDGVFMISFIKKKQSYVMTGVTNGKQIIYEETRKVPSPSPVNFTSNGRVVVENRQGDLVAWAKSDPSKLIRGSIDPEFEMDFDGANVVGVKDGYARTVSVR